MPKTQPANEVDIGVGAKIRTYRVAVGMSQTQLAEKLGVTFQQVQKYEKGLNRIGAGRLHKIACALGLRVTDLFASTLVDANENDTSVPDPMLAFVSTRDGLQLNSAFVRINDVRVRQRLIGLVVALASDDKKR